MVNTVFGLVEIGRSFNFIGSPVTFRKVSDFTAEVISSPCINYDDEPVICSILTGHFETDSMVTIESDLHLCFDRAEAVAFILANPDFGTE